MTCTNHTPATFNDDLPTAPRTRVRIAATEAENVTALARHEEDTRQRAHLVRTLKALCADPDALVRVFEELTDDELAALEQEAGGLLHARRELRGWEELEAEV
ncbi:hypothetical protein [Zoogloea sp.]|uniref:hypothetical protein n=1 Tax=Zoogloea sp. TaxID=49181 RepID=UPI0035B1FE36